MRRSVGMWRSGGRCGERRGRCRTVCRVSVGKVLGCGEA